MKEEELPGLRHNIGDSRLLPEHLQMPTPDAIIFNFSDNSWHIGLQGAIKLANTYPNISLGKCRCTKYGCI